MGRVVGPYGLRGWLRVVPYSDERDALVGHGEWWVGDEPRRVEDAKLHGAAVVAKLAGIESREAALALKGRTVSVPRDALPVPEEGRYYYADLVGLDVVNLQGERLGRVASLDSNGAHDVMALDDGKRLLPWIPQVVRKVDLEAGRIEVDWGTDW